MITQREFFMIHQYKSEGLSNRAIAQRLGIDRKTVTRHLCQDAQDPGALQRVVNPSKLEPYRAYLSERLQQFPELTARRLQREIQQLGYRGGYSILCDYLRQIRPAAVRRFEIRFETPAGEQAQVDFSCCKIRYNEAPEQVRKVWLFSMVLGHSRYLWGRFCEDQQLHTVLRLHIEAFESLGGVPRHLLYDRMKTAVSGTDGDTGEVIFNPSLLSCLHHYGAYPRACQPYRPQTKGKIERIFGYVKKDFILGTSFDSLSHLNGCFDQWRSEVANVRCHGTTGRVVSDAFEEERTKLIPLPAIRYRALVATERKVNNEGMVAYRGSVYSVPDGTTSRIVEVQAQACELCIIDHGEVIARHPIAPSRGSRVMDPGHRKSKAGSPVDVDGGANDGSRSMRRALSFYEAVGRRLASS